MSTLHEQLTAALDQWEATARAATPGPWTTENAYTPTRGCRCLSCYDPVPGAKIIPEIDGPPGFDTSPTVYDHDAHHIAANDPATVLRQIAAWRDVVVGHHPRLFQPEPGTFEDMCSYEYSDGFGYVIFWHECPVIKAACLALGVNAVNEAEGT